ncbi:MAG: prephenate/arogenate dehydrogenase family protein [Alphaproteobacteria bacterium]|nr:prephenate/arogenate dehydrogenase family protein [Alphaproteobacteria bacterium]
MFDKIALIGLGLIGSSLCHVIRREGRAGKITGHARSAETRATALKIGLVDEIFEDAAAAVDGADLVILCVPVGAIGTVAEAISGNLKAGAIVTDVGSVKETVVRDISPHLPDGVHLVPGHPIAGTEHSGPESGFSELFENRWCILTPLPDGDEATTQKLEAFWIACGSNVERMEVAHHDLVLAITSHVPHLIAYNIVMTAKHLEDVTDSEVIKFSAAGFRDFTRIAASDPTMWRDVFLNNKHAVLEILGRFSEDLAALQRAVRWGDGDMLFDLFARSRAVRRGIVEAGQDTDAPDFGRRS